MTAKLDRSMRNQIIDDLIDFGVLGVGDLKIYTGTQPADPNSAATGTLLVTIPISNGFSPASNGSTSLSIGPESGTAVASGTAGWARLVQGSYNIDGSVATSGGDFTINTLTISTGDSISLTAFSLTQPES